MKIAIDSQTILGKKAGMGFYVKNLIENLKKIDQKNDYIIIQPNSEQDLSTPKRWWWDQIQVPRLAKKQRADILHQPCFSAPVFYQGKIVVTAHDIISLIFPHALPFWSKMFFSRWMPFSYRKADKIITDSEQSKKDIVDRLHFLPDKVKVIYLAAGKEFQPVRDPYKIERVKNKYHIQGDFFLHVGTLEPRKNLEFLIRVYAQVIKNSKINHKLVITGKKGWYYQGLFKLIQDLGLKDMIIFTGYVEDSDLPVLYSSSSVFLFPSLYEGFGLPPLEAMASGVPVVSSNTSSLPEVIGQAGILLPPDKVTLWAEKIIRLLDDKKLYQTLRQKGLMQAKKFSWEKCARETLEVYNEICAKD